MPIYSNFFIKINSFAPFLTIKGFLCLRNDFIGLKHAYL